MEIACQLRGRGGLGRVVVGLEAGVGVGDADFALLARGAEGLNRQAVGEQQVVDDARRDAEVADPRGQQSDPVTQIRGDARLVVGDPAGGAIPETLVEEGSVIGEAVRRLPVGPPAQILEGLGEVPVIQGDARLDARCQQLVDQPRVEVDSLLVHLPESEGQDPGPGDREAIGLKPELGHQRHVFPVAVVVIAGDIPGLSAEDPSRLLAVDIPDGESLAVLTGGAFDLIGGRGGAPLEGLRKRDERHRSATPRAVGGYHSRMLRGSYQVEPLLIGVRMAPRGRLAPGGAPL